MHVYTLWLVYEVQIHPAFYLMKSPVWLRSNLNFTTGPSKGIAQNTGTLDFQRTWRLQCMSEEKKSWVSQNGICQMGSIVLAGCQKLDLFALSGELGSQMLIISGRIKLKLSWCFLHHQNLKPFIGDVHYTASPLLWCCKFWGWNVEYHSAEYVLRTGNECLRHNAVLEHAQDAVPPTSGYWIGEAGIKRSR